MIKVGIAMKFKKAALVLTCASLRLDYVHIANGRTILGRRYCATMSEIKLRVSDLLCASSRMQSAELVHS